MGTLYSSLTKYLNRKMIQLEVITNAYEYDKMLEKLRAYTFAEADRVLGGDLSPQTHGRTMEGYHLCYELCGRALKAERETTTIMKVYQDAIRYMISREEPLLLALMPLVRPGGGVPHEIIRYFIRIHTFIRTLNTSFRYYDRSDDHRPLAHLAFEMMDTFHRKLISTPSLTMHILNRYDDSIVGLTQDEMIKCLELIIWRLSVAYTATLMAWLPTHEDHDTVLRHFHFRPWTIREVFCRMAEVQHPPRAVRIPLINTLMYIQDVGCTKESSKIKVAIALSKLKCTEAKRNFYRKMTYLCLLMDYRYQHLSPFGRLPPEHLRLIHKTLTPW